MKVIVGVSPLSRDERFELMLVVGGVVSAVTVSIGRVTELLASEPSLLVFPAESEKAPDGIVIRASVVLSSFGVKMAVYKCVER